MADVIDNPGFAEEGLPPFLFTFEQFERMDEEGFFDASGGRVELIEGRIVQMAPAGGEHTTVTSDLLGLFYSALRAAGLHDLKALTQGTLRIADHSAPEPDVFIARRALRGRYFRAEDAVLVIEVAVSSYRPDQSAKAPMYARAGIPELWIVEPGKRRVHVHRGPRDDGGWDDVAVVCEGVIHPLFAPAIGISLAEVFADL